MLIEKDVGQIEDKIVAAFKKVVLMDNVGEFRVDSYRVSLKKIFMAADISLC